MSQSHPGSTNKKRNYTSPQKTQTSIVTFTNQNAPQKKFNSNHTPQRSAISRSQELILGLTSPPHSGKNLALSNNPFNVLSQEEEEEEDNSRSSVGMSQEVCVPDTASLKTGDTVETEPSSITISSAEQALLSIRAQQALKKLRLAKKALTDTSIRKELEAVYGVEDARQLTDTMLEQAFSPDQGKKADAQKMTENPAESIADYKGNAQKHSSQEEAMDIDQANEKLISSSEDLIASDKINSASKTKSDDTTWLEHTEDDDRTSQTLEREQLTSPGTTPSKSSTAFDPKPPNTTRNVSFAAAVKKTPNSHHLRQGIQQPTMNTIPTNPYSRTEQGTIHVRPMLPQRQLDKPIQLKKNNFRPFIHRYTLRFKTIKPKSEDEGYQNIKETLQRFLEVLLQAEPKTIIPPYLDLDRNDKSVQDLSSAFQVSSLDAHHVVKKYFFRLSPRDEERVSWCSIILAQPIPFTTFMDKAKYSLENNDFSLWPKASDNENSTDVGWLLYSTRAQDEERLTDLLCRITGENIGVKWKAIKANSGNIRSKDQTPQEEKTKALHIECAVDRMQEVRDKLTKWYSSASKHFPDGTKMRLVPTLTSVISIDNKIKFASCIARQAALTVGLASANTREMTTNLLLNRKDPSTN